MNKITQEEYDRDEMIRRETVARQLGWRPTYDYGCVLVEGEDGEWYADYDLNAYLD